MSFTNIFTLHQVSAALWHRSASGVYTQIGDLGCWESAEIERSRGQDTPRQFGPPVLTRFPMGEEHRVALAGFWGNVRESDLSLPYLIPTARGRYVLTLVMHDVDRDEWQKHTFWHVISPQDSLSASSTREAFAQGLQFSSLYHTHAAGNGAPPAHTPSSLGIITYHAKGQATPLFSYDFSEHTIATLPGNTGQATFGTTGTSGTSGTVLSLLDEEDSLQPVVTLANNATTFAGAITVRGCGTFPYPSGPEISLTFGDETEVWAEIDVSGNYATASLSEVHSTSGATPPAPFFTLGDLHLGKTGTIGTGISCV